MSDSEKTRPPVSSRTRILNAATQVFSEKGFDAARVDDIALRASVTKPLIYYYFKSKQEILEEIVQEFLSAVVNFKIESISSVERQGKDYINDLFEKRVALMKENRTVLRVIAMEILKSTGSGQSILKKLFEMHVKEFPRDSKEEIKDDLFVAGFYFSVLPTLGLILFGEEFSRFFDIERDRLDNKFFEMMKSMFMERIWDLLNET